MTLSVPISDGSAVESLLFSPEGAPLGTWRVCDKCTSPSLQDCLLFLSVSFPFSSFFPSFLFKKHFFKIKFIVIRCLLQVKNSSASLLFKKSSPYPPSISSQWQAVFILLFLDFLVLNIFVSHSSFLSLTYACVHIHRFFSIPKAPDILGWTMCNFWSIKTAISYFST